MNFASIGQLAQLRYKLLWAKTRSRNGRIALFLAGYVLLLLLLLLLSAGGFAAAMAAVRAGKAEQVAQAVLGVLFLQAIVSTTIVGFGLNAIFSETELRRYPLSALDRSAARHLTGILDPFWFLFLALELGLGIGLYAMDAAGFWSATVAALLLFVCNYLVARAVAALIDWLIGRKGGTAILLILVMALAFLPAVIAPQFKKNPQLGGAIVAHLHGTPPFAAAAAMVQSGAKAIEGFAVLLGWIAGLAGVLAWMEKRPVQRRAAASVKIAWGNPLDRIGALFGPRDGPLVAHWLTFYTRSTRTRTMALLAVPLAAFLTFSSSRQSGPDGIFVAALGTISIASFFGASRIAVNQFGYSGGGFRRYFLLPIEPRTLARAGSFAALVLGAAMLVVALAAWIAFAPVAFDPRMVLMLFASGVTGLFLFNACGVWVSLLNPRKGNYYSNFGNDLSLGGNIVLIGGVMCALALPRILAKFAPAAVSPVNWWLPLPGAVLAVALYAVTLKLAGPVFQARREKILAVVEGRD